MPPKRIVLIGGGHTHALVLHELRSAPLENTELQVINPGTTAPYSGMLPGFVAGHYRRDELDIDLASLTRRVRAELIDGRAIAMDPAAKRILLDDGTELFFDVASLDVGITSEMPQLEGFASHGIPAKPLAGFAERWESYRGSAGIKSIVVIGGGIAGAELSIAMSYALHSLGHQASVKLLDRGRILAVNSIRTQRRVRKELSRNHVDVIENVVVQRVTETSVVLDDETRLEANFVVGAAGATPHPWLKDTGLGLHEGFIVVDRSLQSSVVGVFAVGDCAHLAFDPRPKAGVFAVRQAPVLLENLRRTARGAPLLRYKPQKDYLKLVSLGGKKAFGEKHGLGFSGRMMWRLKDSIDRRFMRQFRDTDQINEASSVHPDSRGGFQGHMKR
ncbi:MAG: FAD-dependent oxidoreductase [Planctomycetota bacterium]